MPYRRLPNTDSARIRAMKKALEMGKNISPLKLAFSAKNLIRLQKFYPTFEQCILFQRQTLVIQMKKSRSFSETERKARIYITHFLKVMNMAVYRGELPPETRAFYGLASNESTIPSMNSENELISWGRRIIEGEEFRIKKGGTPITNPTIAVVKVRFGQFQDAVNHSKTVAKRNNEYCSRLNELRNEADDLILNLWNEIEASFSNLEDADKRSRCEEYGLIYFFRKSELIKASYVQAENMSDAAVENPLNHLAEQLSSVMQTRDNTISFPPG